MVSIEKTKKTLEKSLWKGSRSFWRRAKKKKKKKMQEFGFKQNKIKFGWV